MAEDQIVSTVTAKKPSKNEAQYSKTGKMVMDAILNLNERKGSSIMKIRNYISAKNPDLDMTRYGKLVKKFVLSAVAKGELKANDETKGSRAFFRIVAKKKKEVEKILEKSLKGGKSSVLKTSKNASSPKVKKPVSKTVKYPAAVAASTIKKKSKLQSKSNTGEKESASKSKKKTSVTKRTMKTEDEAPVAKKLAKKDNRVEKPKTKAKSKRAKSIEPSNENDEPKQAETEEKVSKGKKKTETEKSEKVASKKKKNVKADDENKE